MTSDVAIKDVELGQLGAHPSTEHLTSMRFDTSRVETTIVWRGLNKYVDAIDHATQNSSKKQILFDVSGMAKPTEMIALMGPSGSGKTTLLNILSGRGLADLQGSMYMNGVRFQKSMRKTIAYVLQEDLFYNQLTVQEQLMFTASLRLSESLTKNEKLSAVEHVIKILNMTKCAHTKLLLVSGGERKRCNIGSELLTNPSVLLLDEPTSGLDSNAANSLIRTVKQLSKDRMTVIMSIHQPSTKIFYSFTKLILLADGHIVYNGAPNGIMQYLSTHGFIAPGDYNPSDFVMDLVTATEPPAPDQPTHRQTLISSWNNDKVMQDIRQELNMDDVVTDEEEVDDVTVDHVTSYRTQFTTLLRRALKQSQGNVFTGINTIQTVAIGIISGLAWFQMPNTEDKARDKAGFIFFFMTYWFMRTMFYGMMEFLPERDLIVKDRAAGAYHLSAYFLSKTASELPVRLCMPCLYLAIAYPMAGMNPNAGIFFAITGTQLLAALGGESVGLLIGTITLDMKKCIVIATLVALSFMLVGGYFIQNLPVFVSWFKYLSPFKYSYDACMQLEFSRPVACDNGEDLPACLDGRSSVSGEYVVDFFGVEDYTVGFNIGMLVVLIIGYRVFAYLALKYIPHNNGRK